MKIKNGLMILAVGLVLAVGLGAKYCRGNTGWNPFETVTPAAETMAPVNKFILKHFKEHGEYPAERDVQDVARKNIPYIMIYYSFHATGYQVAFWDGEYTWIYDSAADEAFKMTDDVSRTAWYDRENRKLLDPKAAAAQIKELKYKRL